MNFGKRSLSESSSDEGEAKKIRTVTVTVPKKRKWIENDIQASPTETHSSSDEEAKPCFSHLKRSKTTSLQGLQDESGATSESSVEDENTADQENGRLSLPPQKANFYGATKKKKKNEPVINNVAMKMMASMGYKAGEGLGKFGQGRREIIETSKQKGHRGLGFKVQGLEPCDMEWDFKMEHISVQLDVRWIPSCNEEPPSMVELRSWVKEGTKKLDIRDEVHFCDPKILVEILQCKSIFDNLEPEELRKARMRSNPFETIRGVIFQNRAAMKMAEMDATFDFMFTNPKDEQWTKTANDLLYFADICAGPGGFSEYVLWRKKWHCKGFGFTLRGSNDFKLEEFFAGTPETFEPHYGVNGVQGNGDIYVPENLREFRRFVLENTEGKGVHCVMADGGFSVEGQENIQEILSKRLYLCQFLCALYILRTGGHFVCKVFDLFTPFSIGLVYLLHRAFRQVCIHKPNTSRPANSERYIVCKWKRENCNTIADYMFEINCRLKELEGDEDIIEVVPMQLMKDEAYFYDYIFDSNNTLGKWQTTGLAKIQAFAKDNNLHETRQVELRRESLEHWKVPDKMRSNPARPEPGAKFRELIGIESVDYLGYRAEELDMKKLESFVSIFDYRCLVSGVDVESRSDRAFFLGLGRSHIFRWDGTMGTRWIKADLNLDLPAGTLVYAEVLQELKGEGRAQRKITALQIIDGLFLGGEDIREMHFTQRISQCQLLVKAVSKPSRMDYTPISVKEVYRLEEIEKIFNRIEMKTVKGAGNYDRMVYRMENERHFIPTGLLIVKTENDPWTIAFSKTSKRKYHFNIKTRESSYECPPGAITDFKLTFSKRLFWPWEKGVRILNWHPADEGRIHRDTVTQFVARKLHA